MGLPRSRRRSHPEGVRIIPTSNGGCSVLSRAAEVKGGRRTWQPRVSHTRAALLVRLHDSIASGLCKETRVPRATASQSFRVGPRQPHLPDAPEGTALEDITYRDAAGRAGERQSGSSPPATHQNRLGTLKHPHAQAAPQTKEMRPVGSEGQKATRHQEFLTLSRLFILLCTPGRV